MSERAGAAAFLLAVATLVGLSACGMPASTEPVFVRSPEARGAVQDAARVPPEPDGANSATILVQRYLQAAAGANNVDRLAIAQDRVRQFLTEEARANWQKPKSLTVVRAVLGPETPLGGGRSTITAQLFPMGLLSADGVVLQPGGDVAQTVTFEVVTVNGQMRLAQVPYNLMLLSEDGLKSLYKPQQIYFWENQVDRPTLVPDMRYMPLEISVAKRPGEIVRWLTTGPSEWLVPRELKTKDTPVAAQQVLIVNLNSDAAKLGKDDLGRFAQQLRWSIPEHPAIDLRIEGTRNEANSDDYVSQNLAVLPPSDAGAPEKFCVVDHRARPVSGSEESRTPILLAKENSDVVYAAVTREKDLAGLVRVEGGRKVLWIGSLRAGTSSPVYTRTSVVGTRVSRPVWIKRPTPRALVINDGRIFAVTPQTGTADQPVVPVVARKRELPIGVSALSVAPDGRRIALIAGGQVLVATLVFEGGQIGIDDYRVVATTLAVLAVDHPRDRRRADRRHQGLDGVDRDRRHRPGRGSHRGLRGVHHRRAVGPPGQPPRAGSALRHVRGE